MILRSIKNQFSRFVREEDGSQIVEMAIMTPLMMWAFVATLQYFDAFRTELISTKAALTMADMISREATINSNYLDNTEKLFQFLTLTEVPPTFRVTEFYWDEPTKKYKVVWSENRGNIGNLDDEGLLAVAGRIPILTDQERAFVVQTWTTYTPKFAFGMLAIMKGASLKTVQMKTFVVMSPRFTPKVCYDPETGIAEDVKC